MERDEESELSHHGARLFAPWLARWISPDPSGLTAESNLYLYGLDNPIRYSDRNGRDPQDSEDEPVVKRNPLCLGPFSCGSFAPITEEQLKAEEEVKAVLEEKEYQRQKEKRIRSVPLKERIRKAQWDAPSRDETFSYGWEHELFLESEREAVQAILYENVPEEFENIKKKVEQERYNNWVNQGRQVRNNLQLQAIQSALVPGAFGPKVGAAYAGIQSGQIAADVYQGAGAEDAGNIALAVVVLVIIGRKGSSSVGAPQIAMGDVKSIYSYERKNGLLHISEMEGRGKYNTNGNIGIAVYDRATGEVYFQVFGPRSGNDPRRVIWEGPIGRIPIPKGMTPINIGHAVEQDVRDLVTRATGQEFLSKRSNAHGPDLIPKR
jgi:RHS repeat-associated protein